MKNIARYIDHTNLKPDAAAEDIIKLCSEAKEYGFKSVCINPYYVPLAAKLLRDSNVLVCTVIGFPLGNNTTHIKSLEAKQAVDRGAQEVDMVINIGALKSGDLDYVREDIKAVVAAAKEKKAVVKVIIENCFLAEDEKKIACRLAQEAGADFVKTSTGFGTGGATVADVRLMMSVVGSAMEIKAAGGIRDYKTALEMIEAGADRIGASAGIEIVRQSCE